MKTKLVFLVALLALIAMASMATADGFSVTITVTDNGTETGTPQANVKVDLIGITTSYSETIYTDSNGDAVFPNVPYGTYDVSGEVVTSEIIVDGCNGDDDDGCIMFGENLY